MRKFLFAALLVLAACSQAPAPVLVSKDVFALGYSSANDAAAAAIKAAVASSKDYERGGGILQGGDGKFYWTAPVGGSDPGEVKFEVAFNKANFKLVAIYHTHPRECPHVCDNDVTEFFSHTDVETADSLNVNSYIGIIKMHTVSVYVPHKDTLINVKVNPDSDSTETVSLGEQVGFF